MISPLINQSINQSIKCIYIHTCIYTTIVHRLAKAIIEDAEKSGKLKEGDTVVEATSGNTGIAIAMMCAQRGYKCVIVMTESFSIERRALMRMLGAKVILTPGKAKGLGMVEKAQELSELNGTCS